VTVLHARYDIGQRIGGGAMADVYRAHDRDQKRDVALKILRPAFADDPALVARFQREADAIASIDHPNVVKVLGHGSADGSHYIAMELVEGPTLQELIRARGRLSEDDARYLGEQIAAGLAAAHERGVIHRDLKPANILIDASGTAKVSDFGIAHLASMTQLTRTGEILGTPRYLAPEQISGKVDARTDLYALGLVLYELVSGAPPFDGETAFEIARKQLRQRPRALRDAAPGVSRGFETIALRALQKDPAKRFPTAAAMCEALRPPVAAPVAAMAARVRRPTVAASRSFVPAAVALLTTLLLAGAAVGRGIDMPRVAGIARATQAAAASLTPLVTSAPTARPTPSSEATPDATPEPTPEPTREPTPRPTSQATAVPVVPAAQPGDPSVTIARFYELVTAKRYADAAALWSPRMQAVYPPSTNIWGRFDSTRSIQPVSTSVAAGGMVNVTISEVLNDGTVRRYAGQWYLVRSGSGWLMDQPALRPV
jgi:serine/threonine protein kinase